MSYLGQKGILAREETGGEEEGKGKARGCYIGDSLPDVVRTSEKCRK
jgi:hypothetical protein